MLKNEDLLGGLDSDLHSDLVIGNERHVRSPFCPVCRPGFPGSCKCGGFAHASETAIECDRCGPLVELLEAMTLAGEPHLRGQAACPACSPRRPLACVCGGWIHLSPNENGESEEERRCDRCGTHHEEYDL